MARIAGSATILVAQQSFDFAAITTSATDSAAITVPGAEVGDIVLVGAPAGAVAANTAYVGYVSAANAVKIRQIAAGTGGEPAAGVFTVAVIKQG